MALLLIAIYSLGFMHDVIPHCENSNNEKHHHHEHHVHEQSETAYDGHIVHDDHMDEGIYDYLVCLVSDLEQGEDGCNMHHCVKADLPKTFKKQSSDHTIITTKVLTSSFEFIEGTITKFIEGKENNGLPPILNGTSRRGPPFISC